MLRLAGETEGKPAGVPVLRGWQDRRGASGHIEGIAIVLGGGSWVGLGIRMLKFWHEHALFLA